MVLTVVISCSNNEDITPELKVEEIEFFIENFESYPLKTFTYDDAKKSPIIKGRSNCLKASVGTANEHNSGNVDYKSSQNKGTFLALNPQACGSITRTAIIYNREIKIPAIMVPGRPLQVKFKYYETSTIGWGGNNVFKITIKDEDDEWVIESEINKKDIWTEVILDIPNKINTKITSIKIEMGGGEAFAIDDFRVTLK